MNIKKKFIKKIDNKEIFHIKFTNNNNYSVSFYNFGGYLSSILIPNKKKIDFQEDVLLGYNNFEKLSKDESYFNCIIGRVCGRIEKSQFNINNTTYNLYSNNGKHHLHGGLKGFNKKVWKINKIEKKNYLLCELYYESKHLEEGYPGNLKCIVKYILNNNNEFRIEFNATSDEDTFVNLTNHNYWNFHGHNKFYNNILNHSVKIKSKKYFNSNKNLIQSEKLLDISNTKYDFYNYKIIDNSFIQNRGIDVLYLIDHYDSNIRENASVYSESTKMGVMIYSNQPAIQFYTGNMMDNSYEGKMSRKYGINYGICLEPQLFPISTKPIYSKSPLIKKDDKYSSIIIMKLKNNF